MAILKNLEGIISANQSAAFNAGFEIGSSPFFTPLMFANQNKVMANTDISYCVHSTKLLISFYKNYTSKKRGYVSTYRESNSEDTVEIGFIAPTEKKKVSEVTNDPNSMEEDADKVNDDNAVADDIGDDVNATSNITDDHKEEGDEDDDEIWKSMTDKEFLESYPLSTIDDKLDEDFIIYLQYASKLAEKGNNICDFSKYKAWLEKLISEPANTVVKKRTRNIYLSQLVLQLKEGRLSGVLGDMPPEGCLTPARDAFNFANLPTNKTVHDLDVEVTIDNTMFQHISQDGRTYVAAKSLPGGTGMCGYLAVSIGEASKGLWLDSCGRPTKVVEKYPPDIPLMPSSDELLTAGQILPKVASEAKLSDLLKSRVSEEDRKKLMDFYKDILKRIDVILTCYKQTEEPIEIKDPVIKDMLEKIKCETATVGGLMCAPFDVHTRTLLMALKRKVACKLEKITNRESIIDEIKTSMAETEDLKLVDLSKNIADPNDCAVWNTVKIHKFNKQSNVILSKNYGSRITEKINCLFERQKMIIYEQEKNANHEILASYRNAMVEETREYIERYFAARKEWQRVHDVLQELERIQKEIWSVISMDEHVDDGKKPDHSELFATATQDIQKQIDAARNMSENLDSEINEMRRRMQIVKNNYKDIYNKMKRTGTQWNEQINLLQCEVKKQERKIQQLKLLIQTTMDPRQSSC